MHSVGVTLVSILPPLLLCPPMILSTALMPPLLISDVLFSPFASLPPDFSAFSTSETWLVSLLTVPVKGPARNRWHTQIQRTLERFDSKAIYKVWMYHTWMPQCPRSENKGAVTTSRTTGVRKGNLTSRTWEECHRGRPHWKGEYIPQTFLPRFHILQGFPIGQTQWEAKDQDFQGPEWGEEGQRVWRGTDTKRDCLCLTMNPADTHLRQFAAAFNALLGLDSPLC